MSRLTLITRCFPGQATSVAQARHWLTTHLAHADAPDQTLEEAQLILSELATNALRHTRSRNGEFTTALSLTPPCLRIAVTDQGSDTSQPMIGEVDLSTVSGRGLWLVSTMACLSVEGDAAGRTVIAELQWPKTAPKKRLRQPLPTPHKSRPR